MIQYNHYYYLIPAELIQILKIEEGYKSSPYLDTLGNLTIGYGHLLSYSQNCIEPNEIILTATESIAELMLKDDIVNVCIIPSYNNLYLEDILKKINSVRSSALLAMIYQMGLNNVLEFKLMLKALDSGNYQDAYNQALNSKWAQQTPARAKRMATMLLKGTLLKYYNV